MKFFRSDEDTICALATPSGQGGIGVIRVSGARAEPIVRSLAPFLPKSLESHRVYYGLLKSPFHQRAIDEVLVSYFAEGRSFTGQHTMEVSFHGSPFLARDILQELQLAGSRMAEPGEFTFRAFMSGRLDLVQAESVLQLIQSESRKSADLALKQLQGGISQILVGLEEQLIWVLANLEANIDFAQEDIQVAQNEVLEDRLGGVLARVEEMLVSYRQGRMVKEGVQVALVGAPNVGKSSLLNALGGEDRAIVTEIPGTTRDRIELRKMVRGQVVNFIDTAGLRKTSDPIEHMGIERTLSLLPSVDCIFWILDGWALCQDRGFADEVLQPLLASPQAPLVAVINKVDLLSVHQRQEVAEWVREFLQGQGLDLGQERIFTISAVSGEGLEALESFLESQMGESFAESSGTISQARHFELLTKAKEGLRVSLGQLAKGVSPEFIIFELQNVLFSVQEVLGKRFDDQVMDRVFREFCLGK